MLELRDVTVRRGGRVILDRVGLAVAPGEHLVLTGPSGAGKSTIPKVALLFEPADEGEVLWDGRTVTAADQAAHRARFLYIGQKPLPFDGSAGQYLDLPFTFAANRARRATPFSRSRSNFSSSAPQSSPNCSPITRFGLKRVLDKTSRRRPLRTLRGDGVDGADEEPVH